MAAVGTCQLDVKLWRWSVAPACADDGL